MVICEESSAEIPQKISQPLKNKYCVEEIEIVGCRLEQLVGSAVPRSSAPPRARLHARLHGLHQAKGFKAGRKLFRKKVRSFEVILGG